MPIHAALTTARTAEVEAPAAVLAENFGQRALADRNPGRQLCNETTRDIARNPGPGVLPQAPPEGGLPELRAGLEADSARWRAIAPLRRERRRWVAVIWHAGAGRYQARPRFKAPAGTIAVGATPAELAAAMDKIERACRAPRSGKLTASPPEIAP
jgi:hypothetical protein